MPSVVGKALVVEAEHAPFQLVDIEVDDTKLADDEVLVKFHASGICHTDLGSWSGKIPARFPCILGHEGAGEVVALGGQASGLAKGDHVIASFCSCGACGACQREEPGRCDAFIPLNFAFLNKDMQPDAIPYTNGADKKEACIKYFGQSSFASVMRVSHRSLTKVPADVKPSVACALACGFQTGFSTVVEKASRDAASVTRSFEHYKLLSSKDIRVEDVRAVKPGSGDDKSAPANIFADQTLVVSGIGAVGLGALTAGEMLGFGKVIAVDIEESRLELARRAKATDAIDASQFSDTDKFVEQVKQISVHGRGATLFVEASGAPPALKNGIMSLAIAGKAIILGTPPSTALLEVPSGLILANAWTIEGVLMGNSEPSVTIPYMVELARQGKLDILQEITKIYKPDQMNEAVHDAEKGITIKGVIDWS